MTEIEELRVKLAASERRAVDAEAQAAVMRAALTDAEDTIRDQAARFGAGFPCSVIDACEAATATDAGRALLDRLTAAETRVADMESVREEQAAKLRRHLDEVQAATAYIKDLEAENASLRASITPEHFACPNCGPHQKSDEDGCCATCGADLGISPCDPPLTTKEPTP